jgi:hypothetical protein
MPEHEEIKIKTFIRRCEEDWKLDYQLWLNEKPQILLDEPFIEDYLAYEIYNYKYGKNN